MTASVPEPLFGDDFFDAGSSATIDGATAAARTSDTAPSDPTPTSLSSTALSPSPAAPRWPLLGVFDLETTGVDVVTDRIVTAHVGVLNEDGSVSRHRTWMADPGIPIPDGAAAIHGISTAHARAHGRPSGEVIAEIVAELRSLFAEGIPVVAYNAPFDFSLLKYEARRHGVEEIADPSPVIDPLVVDKTFDRFRRGKRTLDAVAAHYDVLLDAAHDAAADAIAAGRVALAIAARFADRLPASTSELHTQQVAWARAQAESLTEYFIRIGRLAPSEELDGAWPIR